MLICPVCAQALQRNDGALRCPAGHSFDVAKEGYVNLLRSTKNGDLIGDDKFSARSRRDFLNRGYYAPLQEELCRIMSDVEGILLDICCGEGYYTSALAQIPGLQVYGFDISREMVRLAAKRGCGTYFVANLAHIPLPESSVDICTHLFAPFQETSFYRVLKSGGKLYTVIPGKYHLWELKQAVYDEPYVNDEKLPLTTHLQFISSHKISGKITLSSQDDIQAVFRMTPYYFRTAEKDKRKLLPLQQLETTIEFVIVEYVKPTGEML